MWAAWVIDKVVCALYVACQMKCVYFLCLLFVGICNIDLYIIVFSCWDIGCVLPQKKNWMPILIRHNIPLFCKIYAYICSHLTFPFDLSLEKHFVFTFFFFFFTSFLFFSLCFLNLSFSFCFPLSYSFCLCRLQLMTTKLVFH